jgi:hypothetical protein
MDSVVESARDPRWSDQAHSAIVLMVVFKGMERVYGEIPFAASPDDSEPHGVELFQRALAGEFGEVQEPTVDMVKAQVMCRRVDLSATATARINTLVADLEVLQDAVSMDMATAEQSALIPAQKAELDAWRLYRVRLAGLDTQPGFPLSVEWPESPAQPFVYVKPVDTSAPVQGVSKAELPKE